MNPSKLTTTTVLQNGTSDRNKHIYRMNKRPPVSQRANQLTSNRSEAVSYALARTG